jgi:hypothetical protein
MPSLRMLDVAIGMTFVFLLISLICTAIHELIEALLKKRAQDLEKGIKELLGDTTKGRGGFAAKIYGHGLVQGLFRGTYATSKQLPSYIPARTFALALMDAVMPAGEGEDKSGAAGAATGKAPGGDNAAATGQAAGAAALGKTLLLRPLRLRTH